MISLTAKRHQSESANFKHISLGEKGKRSQTALNIYIILRCFFFCFEYIFKWQRKSSMYCPAEENMNENHVLTFDLIYNQIFVNWILSVKLSVV